MITKTYKDHAGTTRELMLGNDQGIETIQSIERLLESHNHLLRKATDLESRVKTLNRYIREIAKSLGVPEDKLYRLRWDERQLVSLCIGTISVMVRKGKQLSSKCTRLQKSVDFINQMDLWR